MSFRPASSLLLAILSASTAHCAISMTMEPPGAPLSDGGSADSGAPDGGAPDSAVPAESPSCAEIERTCVGAESVVVRGYAEGLGELEGARAEFGVRYLAREFEGEGLSVPHYVARGTTTVRAGAFEACVCVPYNAGLYPEIVGAVFAEGTVGTLGRDVLRAYYSQRYATLGTEDMTGPLDEPRTALLNEVAAAALSERSVTVAVSGTAPATAGTRVFAGLVADERPLAPELSGGGVSPDGTLTLSWFRPGAALAGERLVLVVDQNGNGGCDDGDLATAVPFDGRAALVAGPWVGGADLLGACTALSVNDPRE